MFTSNTASRSPAETPKIRGETGLTATQPVFQWLSLTPIIKNFIRMAVRPVSAGTFGAVLPGDLYIIIYDNCYLIILINLINKIKN